MGLQDNTEHLCSWLTAGPPRLHSRRQNSLAGVLPAEVFPCSSHWLPCEGQRYWCSANLKNQQRAKQWSRDLNSHPPILSNSRHLVFPVRHCLTHSDLLSIENDLDLGKDVSNVGSSINNEVKQVEMCFCLVLGTWFLSLSDSICDQDWALQPLNLAPLTLYYLAQVKQAGLPRLEG